MKLTDLAPHWIVLEEGGPRVGVTFRCPHCPAGERGETTFLGVAFHHTAHADADDSYIRSHWKDRHIWNLESAEDFAVLTISPSVDASGSGHWHGFIRNGEIQ